MRKNVLGGPAGEIEPDPVGQEPEAGLGELGAARVVEGDVELQPAVGGGALLGAGQLGGAGTLSDVNPAAYPSLAQIAGHGLLAFRDPFGIRPLSFGVNETDQGTEYLVASESVALEGLGFRFVRDIAPGEAVFVDFEGRFFEQQCAEGAVLSPCLFEYVYLARPDSMIDGVSVYAARLRLGEYLARRVAERVRWLEAQRRER